jgi:hypothetical protein
MARTADHDAASPTPAPVLTPDGQRWLLERVAWLAAEPDQAGWSDDTYARGAAELARLNEILAQAITTEELPPEQPGVVELGDEVLVEFAADETERFLLVDPVGPRWTSCASRSSHRWPRRCSAAASASRSRSRHPPVATNAASSPPAGSRRRRPRTAVLPDGEGRRVVFVRYAPAKIR